jgi:hypothetical protein
VPVAFTLTFDMAEVSRVSRTAALAEVTDTTRRVFNRATVLTPVDTGRLRAGNHMRVQPTTTGAVGEVFNNTAYARAVHDGTREYVVRPRRKQALRFTVGGEVVFAMSARIPARAGRPWMYRALVEICTPRGYTVTRV